MSVRSARKPQSAIWVACERLGLWICHGHLYVRSDNSVKNLIGDNWNLNAVLMKFYFGICLLMSLSEDYTGKGTKFEFFSRLSLATQL